MPNINEFIGPVPSDDIKNNLEKVIGRKPCFKCELDSEEYFWDPSKYTMTWTCKNNHVNTVAVNQ